MTYLFSEKNATRRMIKGAYKKIKSHIYYDKTLLFAKKTLAVFEADNNFYDRIEQMTEALVCKDYMFFEELINKVDFKVLPKSFKSVDSSEDIVKTDIDNRRFVDRLNFFIDMPGELYIIDCLWTLLLGKLVYDNKGCFKYAAATAFKKSVYEKEDCSLGIDFDSNRFLKPYYELYSKWRDDAFKIIEKNKDDKNMILLSLDLKSFYYSVEFDFNMLSDFFPEKRAEIHSFNFLTSIIKNIYVKYTQIIKEYKKGIGKNGKYIFPIGAMSPYVLREIYLNNLDKNITCNIDNILYYNRYVDDILIVVESNNNGINRENVIDSFFIKTNIATKNKDNVIKFVGYNNIKIQAEKINCFYFNKGNKNIFIEVFKEAIAMNSSENNLLPDIGMLNKSFVRSAYSIKNLEFGHKIRDLGFLQNNNYRAAKLISDLQRLVKNVYITSKELSNQLEQIEEFYSGSNCIEFSNNWRSIFELYIMCGEKTRLGEFIKKIEEEIGLINFENIDKKELLSKKEKYICRKVKKHLKEKLNIAASLAGSLDDRVFRKNSKLKLYAKIFKKTNFLNHRMVSYPLINYCEEDRMNLVTKDISDFIDVLNLDKHKLEYTPRFIRLDELCMYESLRIIGTNEEKIDLKTIFKNYILYNNLSSKNNLYETEFFIPCEENCDRINAYEISVNGEYSNSPKIAFINTKLEENHVVESLKQPEKQLTLENKQKLFRALNAAKEEKIEILVFPEFYLPMIWLSDIMKFITDNKITVITGMKYIKSKKGELHNNVCNLIPVKSGVKFFQTIVLIREKNYYAPNEKIEILKNGYCYKETEHPIYIIVKNKEYRYCIVLCYEFTDIYVRAFLKGKIDILFVPQLNRDTGYFSAIVTSSARDLHCFIVQANTAVYGDSRITAPYRSLEKDLIRIKGGDNDVILASQLEVGNLLNFRKAYTDFFKQNIANCFNCKKDCSKCNKKFKENKIKGSPPNFIIE